MNCFWKSINPNNNGDTYKSVPAEMIDQLTPNSGAPNMANPTVSGRVSTELVLTSGHKKLFQW